MRVTRSFGLSSEGQPASLYTLKSPIVEVDITDYGATVVGIRCSDKYGQMDDVIVGFPDVTGYERHGRRLACEQDCLASRRNRTHDLGKEMWKAESEGNRSIKFHHCHRRGEGGHTENLDCWVKYKLCGSELEIQQTSSPDYTVNAGKRIYFNLSGHNSWRDMKDHLVTLYSDSYLEPNGALASVENTPFDLRKPTFFKSDRLQLIQDAGARSQPYFCLSNEVKRKLVARVKHVRNGKTMTVETSQSFVALDIANSFNGIQGKAGINYQKNSCLSFSPLPRLAEGDGSLATASSSHIQSLWFNFSHAL